MLQRVGVGDKFDVIILHSNMITDIICEHCFGESSGLLQPPDGFDVDLSAPMTH